MHDVPLRARWRWRAAVLVAATATLLLGGAVLVRRTRLTERSVAAPATPIPSMPDRLTAPAVPFDTLEARVTRRFGRLASGEIPEVLDHPRPATMEVIVAAAGDAVAGRAREAERTLSAAIAAEPDAVVRESLELRVADALMLQRTVEARTRARNLFLHLGRTTSVFHIQLNALLTLERLEAEAATEPTTASGRASGGSDAIFSR